MNPLSYTEMFNYFSLIQETPEPYEVKLLNTLDREILSVYAEQSAKELKSKK